MRGVDKEPTLSEDCAFAGAARARAVGDHGAMPRPTSSFLATPALAFGPSLSAAQSVPVRGVRSVLESAPSCSSARIVNRAVFAASGGTSSQQQPEQLGASEQPQRHAPGRTNAVSRPLQPSLPRSASHRSTCLLLASSDAVCYSLACRCPLSFCECCSPRSLAGEIRRSATPDRPTTRTAATTHTRAALSRVSVLCTSRAHCQSHSCCSVPSGAVCCSLRVLLLCDCRSAGPGREPKNSDNLTLPTFEHNKLTKSHHCITQQ